MKYLIRTHRTILCLCSTALTFGCSKTDDRPAEPKGGGDRATMDDTDSFGDTESIGDTDPTDDSADSNSGEAVVDTASDSRGDLDAGAEGPDITVEILEKDVVLEDQTITKTIRTVLEVTWRQKTTADEVWLRFSFENDEWYESPRKPGETGVHREVVLGVPEETEVAIHVMSLKDGEEAVVYETSGTTGSLPESVPRATILEYDPSLASANRWMIGSVENTANETATYEGPFVILIIDRQGRVVWYYLDQAWNPCMAFPRITGEGTYLGIDRSERHGENERSVIKTTLDLEQFELFSTPRMADGMTITDDGTIIWTSTEWLSERHPDGTVRQIWSCPDWLEETNTSSTSLTCYANTVNWNPLKDSILLSYPGINTVVEVSRETGEVIGQYGQVTGSWDFVPSSRGELECVHGGNITEEGTLLVSVHEAGAGFAREPVPHFFVEFELDYENRVAEEIWRYGEGIDDFPRAKGEAYRVEGGNTLVNYGTGGIIREVTPDGLTAWHVIYDADFEVEFTNKMVGHTILIDDLYALTRGW